MVYGTEDMFHMKPTRRTQLSMSLERSPAIHPITVSGHRVCPCFLFEYVHMYFECAAVVLGVEQCLVSR